MHTIVPLRVANMIGCMFFAAFGALSGNVGTFILYLLLCRSMQFAFVKCSI